MNWMIGVLLQQRGGSVHAGGAAADDADAARGGVLFAPGSQFLTDQGPSRGLRLTLAQANEAEIERGVGILGEVVRRRQELAAAGSDTRAVNM